MSNFNVLKEMIKRFQGKRAILYFGEIILMGIGCGIVNIMISDISGQLSNAAIYGQGLEEIGLLRSLVVVLVIMLWNNFLGVCYNNEAKITSNAIHNLVFAKAFALPMSFYEKNHSGEYMSKLIYDAELASGVFGSRLRRLIMPVLISGICVVPMFLLCPPVMAGLFVLSVISLAMNIGMVPVLKKYSKKISDNNKELTKSITNIISGMDTIRMFPLGRAMLRNYDEANDACADSLIKQGNIEGLVAAIRTAFDLIGSLVFLALGLIYMERTGGRIGNLVSLYILYGTFQYHFLQIGLYIPSLASFLVNGERVLKFLDSEEEPGLVVWANGKDTTGGAAGQPGESGAAEGVLRQIHSLALENLTFGYEGSDSLVFAQYSEQFGRGFTALVGPSGKGKSTLAKLLLGFYPLQGGEIYVNDRPVSQMDIQSFRQQIAYIPQEPYMFHMSVRDNLMLVNPLAAEEEMIAATKAAYAHDFIMALPQGYDTILGERGNSLSGGQRQRLAIARAIIKKSQIVLMDEATSALDHESEAYILDTIDNIKAHTIVIMIAHRPSTIERADRIVELK